MRRVVASNRPSEEITKSDFRHVSHGNFNDTQLAIETFLLSLGRPKQGNLAELIMLMERSFSGKYRKGERSHYQQIMPSENWRPGDSLSEKLTRCKDKETFKNRFDFIGTTAILSRNNFDGFEVCKLDFDGRMYLRLIDTKRNNRSNFYRNDALVDAFIQSAIDFYRGGLKKRRIKTGSPLSENPVMVGSRNPEVVRLENPKPLLYTEFESRKNSRKSKGTSLTLVHSSNTTIDQELPRKEIENTRASDFSLYYQQAAEECGLISESEVVMGSAEAEQDAEAARPFSGQDGFNALRISILSKFPQLCISEKPKVSEISQFNSFVDRFGEFFPKVSIADFFKHLTENWIRACKYFKSTNAWSIRGEYPEIGSLLKHSNHVLSWYLQEIEKSENNNHKKVESLLSFEPQSEQPKKVAAPLKHCEKINGPGRTFVGNHPESLEYQIAVAHGFDQSIDWVRDFLKILNEQIAELSCDAHASKARIEELINMQSDECEKYCC